MTTYTSNGNDNVTFTGSTRNHGHGWQVEVVYSDGSTGWEHYEDILCGNGRLFEYIEGDEEKDSCWDYAGSNDTYETLADAVDAFVTYQTEN